MILAKATWAEVDALDREQVVVVPIGGVEMTGNSAPMGAPSLLAEAVAARLNARFEDEILVVPTVPFATAGGSRGVAGAIDLGIGLLAPLLQSIVRSLAQHRMRKFLLLQVGRSKETFHALMVVARELKNENPHLQIAVYEDSIENPDRHLAALTAIDPNLVKIVEREAVRMDLAMDESLGANSDATGETESIERSWSMEKRFVTDVGEGDVIDWHDTTERMDAEWGEQVLIEITDEVADLIRVMRAGRIYVQWKFDVEQQANGPEKEIGEQH